jgi:hypothetical protein
MSIRIKLVALAATLLLLTGSQSEAAFAGSIGFNDQGQPLANGSATGNIDAASTLTIGDLNTTNATSGLFVGVGKNIDLGSVTFSTSNGANTTFSFTDATGKFGSFVSQTITSIISGNGVESYYILGLFTPGNYTGYGTYATGMANNGPLSASITVSFTQTPAGGGAGSSISDSATMSVPPAGLTVPEPASFAMVAIGLGGIFAVGRFRRRAA